MSAEKLANFLSFILGPQVWLPVLFFLLILKRNIDFQYPAILIPLTFLLQIVIPLIGPYIAYRQGKISSLDLPNRKDRVGFLLIASISWLVSLFLVYFFANFTIFKISLIIFILIFLAFVITSFWKISLHVTINTAGVLFINYLYNWQFLYLFILIPIVAWARYKLKIHTISQLLAGFLVTFVVITIFLNLVK